MRRICSSARYGRRRERYWPANWLVCLITIKSSISVAGRLCELGSVLRRGDVAERDAVAVARLRAEGAIILGTTNCPEFLMAYETDTLLYGCSNNPWDLGRTPGGSSGEEAAAIAAGLSAAGLGSDSGGSVRLPAHFSGICALKPTAERISSTGHVPPCLGPFTTLGAIGPMARSIADVPSARCHCSAAVSVVPLPVAARYSLGLDSKSTATYPNPI